MALKKKIPTPLTADQLRDKMKKAKTIVMPSYAEMPSGEKITKKDVTEEKFSFTTIASVGYSADRIGVDGTGKEHKFPGGMYIYFNWSVPGFGFGELSIKKQAEKIVIDSEGLGKDFVKAMLCSMVDEAEVK